MITSMFFGLQKYVYYDRHQCGTVESEIVRSCFFFDLQTTFHMTICFLNASNLFRSLSMHCNTNLIFHKAKRKFLCHKCQIASFCYRVSFYNLTVLSCHIEYTLHYVIRGVTVLVKSIFAFYVWHDFSSIYSNRFIYIYTFLFIILIPLMFFFCCE